jgi:hypothetical protein
MKRKCERILMLTISGLWLAATASMAAITTTSDNFSTSNNTFSSWIDVGSSAADIKYDANSAKDWWDGDNSTYITNYAPGTNMVVTGDELLNDGGIRLDVANAIEGDEAIGLTIGGTMESNRVITFTGNLYNDNSSYTDVNVQLFNLTDGSLLAESGKIRVLNYNNAAYTPKDFSLRYATTAADHGDTLQIRFRDAVTATARDIYVDEFSVFSEDGVYLNWNFNDDGATGTVLTNNTPKYDYTSDQVYVGSNAVVNTLAFNGRSSGTDYIIRDKGPGYQNALYLKTIDTDNTDFGIYLQKLDFTLNGLNSSNITRVSWSFDILGYDNNGNLDPTNWTVKIAFANTSENLNVSDAWFSSAPTAQTFSFSDDSTGETAKNGTWTTISGSYEIPAASAGSVGGIQISTDAGGYTSSGGIFLDNIEVFITAKAPILSEEFEAWANTYGVSNVTATTHSDTDGLSDLYEYGLGGDPTNENDIGFIPTYSAAADGGTNWFYYVYPKNKSAAIAGLNYYLETDTDLVTAPGWTNGNYEVVATKTDGFGSGFDAVTNRVSTETEAKQFIQLQIDGL